MEDILFLGNGYNLIWTFLMMSFVGWCLEVIYATVVQGKFINRGFLNGPQCPIYGVGGIIIILCTSYFKDNYALVFLVASIAVSALEFFVGFILEKLFHNKWWDYSERPFNIKGYVCLSFSLLWGIAALAAVYLINPSIVWIIKAMPYTLGLTLLIILCVIFVTDTVLSVIQAKKLGNHFKQLEKLSKTFRLGSDAVGMALSETTAVTINNMFKIKEKITSSRIFKSFPTLKSKKYSGKLDNIKDEESHIDINKKDTNN